MERKHVMMAMDRNEELRLGKLDHFGVFVATSVSGNVQWTNAVKLMITVFKNVDAVVTWHPGDLGMRRIAESLTAAILESR